MFFNQAKRNFVFVGILFFLHPCFLLSQNQGKEKENYIYREEGSLFPYKKDSTFTFSESIFNYVDIASLILDSISGSFEDFGANPYLLPPVFDGKFTNDLTIKLEQPPLLEANNKKLFVPEPIQIRTEGKRYVDRLRTKAYRILQYNHMELIKYTKNDFPEEVERIVEVKPNPFSYIFKIGYNPDIENITVSEIFKNQNKYWQKSGSSLIQFSQNHISKNWYNGGTGNLNLLSVQNYTVNYKKDNKQFNNFIEWKLSFHTNTVDTLRSFKIGDDLIRYYGDFGIRAFNDRWSYSTNVEFKTQLFNNYKENSEEIISSWLSPILINVGILGMKYQLEKLFPEKKYKKLDLSADISPFSFQYIYVKNKNVDPTRYGTEEGKRYLMDLGSTINAKLIINFNREITFSSRFKLFTNYEKTIIESENEINILLNRFFSTRLYFYPRFDDSQGVIKDSKLGYFQIIELFSFGFNFKW